MALSQTRPISIPTPSSPSHSSPRSHFRCSSDAGSDLSISFPLGGATTFPLSAVQDPFAAVELNHRLASLTAEDVLSCDSSTRSRLVVFPHDGSIELAGERLAEADHAETWILLERQPERKHTRDSARGPSKLTTSNCVGLLGLEDLSAFFAVVFAPQLSKAVHDPVSPPASPMASPSDFVFPGAHAAPTERVAQIRKVRAQLDAKRAVAASMISNLSGKNALRHVSLDTSLADVLGLLSQPDVNCLVVSDARRSDDSAVCGILTATDVVAFVVAEAERDSVLANALQNTLDALTTVVLQQPAAVISGDRSTVDALVRMQAEQLSVLAVMDPVGGLISPISSREISQEILRSASRKILTTPLSTVVKSLRSRHPQGTDGKDAHPAVSVSNSASVARVAAILLATEAGGVYVVDEPKVVMTPPLSCVSASPGKELPALSLDTDMMPLSRSVSFTPAPAQKHRRSSTQFWTAPRTSFSGGSSESSRPALPTFAVATGGETGRERRASNKPDLTLSSSLASLPKSGSAAMSAHIRTSSAARPLRPRSLSLAHFSLDETNSSRQFGMQAAYRSQGSWTPVTPAAGSGASSAGSPSSPFGNMLVSGFFGEAMQNGMPRHVVTMKTILQSLLAATGAANEEALET